MKSIVAIKYVFFGKCNFFNGTLLSRRTLRYLLQKFAVCVFCMHPVIYFLLEIICFICNIDWFETYKQIYNL